jgi:putative nucleotide binding protein
MTTPESGDDASETATDPETDDGSGDDAERSFAVVLDYLPHGRTDDDRPRYQKSPIAYALGEENFRLLELTMEDDADVSIGDRVVVDPVDERERVARLRDIEYDDLSNAAVSELEYVVEDIVESDEQRFVDFFNDAQPITLRLHQLNLLPGIGKKLRNNILDGRKRGRFEGFDDLTDRVSGLHNPKEVLVDRIMEELREEDLKYRTFVRREE